MNPDMFFDVYGHSPTVHVICPGYLNLIGEHIVDHGYGTISIATDTGSEIFAALNGRSDIRISNTDEEYRQHVLNLPSEWVGTSCPEWFDYILAGWKSVVERLKIDPVGFDLLMEGQYDVFHLQLDYQAVHLSFVPQFLLPGQFILAKALKGYRGEEYVGKTGDRLVHLTQILGRDDMGVRFDFFPLRSHLVNVPHIAVFDVLHSGEVSNKSLCSRHLHLAEGKIAGKEALGKRLEDMIALCENLPETSSRTELEQLLGPEELEECLSEEIKHVTQFKIRSTARYVFSEAIRVNRFERACETRDLLTMGRIFNESHDSFTKDFDCTTKDVEKLVTRCRTSHSYGAHVIGWNGIVVALIDDVCPVYLGDKLVYHAFASAGASIELL
ncbi:hypothetical protein NECAME_11071 [Necator americanus]|uniref:Galactokinase N-terminal domain-containing protein n=1 Tax=Necator americanus TaxID=51031 RepID=W2T8T7_NECAM|nr:hypothetical protein NECAME_11071 [Necator americanus]ETN77402.1 hypothetical protein NECAME_11071 [Necator americanus]